MPEIVQCTCSEEWNGPTLNLDHARGCPWAAIEDAAEAEFDDLARTRAERDMYRDALIVVALANDTIPGVLGEIAHLSKETQDLVRRALHAANSGDGHA